MRYFLFMVGCLVICTGQSFAHHFKGLPHFNYFDNYPQVPQDEFLAQKGRFEFSLVVYDFQGIDRDNAEQPDDVRFFLLIFDLLEATTYKGALSMEILDGQKVIIREDFSTYEEESLYKMQKALDGKGDYVLRVTLKTNPEEQVLIPFVLSAQKINWSLWVAGSLTLVLIITAVGARKARVSRDRKDALKNSGR